AHPRLSALHAVRPHAEHSHERKTLFAGNTSMSSTKPAPSQPTQKPAEHKPLVDTSKLSAGQRAALELPEAARDAASEKGSFAEGIFMGRLDLSRMLPFPEQSAEDRDQGDAFLQRLKKFVQEKVDPDEIDRTGEIPQQ